MSARPTLYGYDPSSYVFSVRMLLAAKAIRYDQVPLDVIAGEPQSEAHRRLHPFGKVPVLEHEGLTIVETVAIMRYLNDAFEGPSFIPETPLDRARMDMAMELHGSYGYATMARVVGYHRFPVFSGHPDRAAVDEALSRLHALFSTVFKNRGDTVFVAGGRPSLGDFYLAPPCFYLELVDELAPLSQIPGFDDWWTRVKALECYQAAIPDLTHWGEQGGD